MKGLHLIAILLCVFRLESHGQQHQFKGSWIANTEDVNAAKAPLFRKVLSVGKPIRSASLYVCGVGFHRITINGRPVSGSVLDQGFTKFNTRLLYQTRNITSLLKIGANAVGVELGNGMYNMQTGTIWGFNQIPWRKSPRLLLDIVLEYTDGTQETVATDASWRTSTGASQFNSLYTGEVYDARKEIKNWDRPGFDDHLWKLSLVTASPGGALEAQTMPDVKVIRQIKPVSVRQVSPNTWLYDMGQNFAGVAALKVKGEAGDTVSMAFNESLGADGRLDRKRNATQLLDSTVVPGFQTDIYILKGGGLETYTPRFTYHGFQYVEVKASPGIKLGLSSLEGLFYSADFKSAGSFESSDSLLNKMYAAALQTYRSNYISIPTDCPQREKMGWTADAHLATELGLWNFDVASSYRKYLKDIKDVQKPEGLLAGVAPTEGVGYHWIDPEDRDFGPAWGSALTLISWYLYLYEGETAILAENYDAIKRYTDMLIRKSSGNLYMTGLGDFLAPVATPKAITSNGYFYQDVLLLSKMAGVLGKKEEALRYAGLAEKIKATYHERFFDAAAGQYRDTTMTALCAPLFQGLTPDEYRVGVAKVLVSRLKYNRYIPEFGMLGAKYVLKSLSDAGYVDEAYRLLTNTAEGGWAYHIAKGATTFPEHWNAEASLSHVWPGTFTDWLFGAVAGIKPDEAAPGFKHFFVKPVFPKGLNWIKARHMTRYGEIKVEWKRSSAGIMLSVMVPKGTRADLDLKGYERKLGAGKHQIVIRQ